MNLLSSISRLRALASLSAAFLIASVGGCSSSPSQIDSESPLEETQGFVQDSVQSPTDLGGGSRGPYPYLTSSGDPVLAIFHPGGQVTATYQGVTLRGEALSQGDFEVISNDPPFVMRCVSDYQQTGQIGICTVLQ